MSITLQEIADIVGVSRGTVDRALNDRPGINAVIRAKIIEVANEKGYRANRAGKMLHTRKSPVRIGVQMPSIGNDFFLDVEQGLIQSAKELEDFGFSLSIKRMKGFDHQEQIQQLYDLVSEGVNGLAFIPINHVSVLQAIEDISSSGIPVITFNTDIDKSSRLAYVGSDYWQSGATAGGVLRLLAQNRPVKVLIMTGSQKIVAHNQRIDGFKSILDQFCPDVDVIGIYETQDDEQISHDVLLEQLAKHPDLGAIYMAAGGVAGAASALEMSGQKDNIFMICNDLTEAERIYLDKCIITATIGQEPFEQGYKTIQYLFSYLLDKSRPPEFTYTRSEVIIREHLLKRPFKQN
jgi:LacI family transcriptional regulator